ncbi:MAG: chromosome segregation protein [Bacteroidetes bacterium]|nr:chromosome segregation protein [Bacteroidota bacterium]
MAQSKVELLLEMKDRMTTSINKAKQTVAQSTADMKSKINSLKTSHIQAFSKMRDSIPGLGNAINLLKNPYIALTAIVAGVGLAINRFTNYVKSSIEEGIVQTLAETKLTTIMKQRMHATDAQVKSVIRLASEQQRLGIIGDEVTVSGAQQMATFLNNKKSLDVLIPAMNNLLAQQKGLNANSEDAVGIGNMMGKAMQGQTTILQRVGITFTDAEKKLIKYGNEQQRAATLAQVIQNNVGKMNEAIAATPEGRMKQLENDMGDLDERIGPIFLSFKTAFMPVYQAIYKLKTAFVDFVDNNKVEIRNFIGGIANVIARLITVIQNVISFMWQWREVFIGLAAAAGILMGIKLAIWAVSAAMAANPIGIIIVGIGLLIGMIIALSRRYEGWATIWNAVKTTLVNSFKQYVNTWKFGFQELWFTIQLFWYKIKSFGEFVGTLFNNVGKAIKEALKGNFSDAKTILSQEIKTKSSIEITRLEKERTANRAKFVDDSKKMAVDIVKSWKDVKLSRANNSQNTTENPFTSNSNNIDSSDDNNSNAPIGDKSEKVTGSAQQIRNITVNIDAFNKGGINTQNTELQHMNGDEIAEWFEDKLTRVLRNIELSY